MEKERAYGTGMWAWLLQRVTGFLLVIYLFLHISWVHFGGVKTPIDFVLDALFVNFKTSVFILLILVVPHALNGFRVFALDFGMGDRAQKVLFWVLFVFGLLLIFLIYNSRFS